MGSHVMFYYVPLPEKLEPGNYFGLQRTITEVVEALKINIKCCLQKITFLLILVSVLTLMGNTISLASNIKSK